MYVVLLALTSFGSRLLARRSLKVFVRANEYTGPQPDEEEEEGDDNESEEEEADITASDGDETNEVVA